MPKINSYKPPIEILKYAFKASFICFSPTIFLILAQLFQLFTPKHCINDAPMSCGFGEGLLMILISAILYIFTFIYGIFIYLNENLQKLKIQRIPLIIGMSVFSSPFVMFTFLSLILSLRDLFIKMPPNEIDLISIIFIFPLTFYVYYWLFDIFLPKTFKY